MKCWVGDCNHHHTREKCKFFTIPCTPLKRRRNAWKTAIANGESPPVHARICSCHFVGGNKEMGPTIFKRHRNPKYQHLWVSPKLKTRKPKRTAQFEVTSVDDPDNPDDSGISLSVVDSSTEASQFGNLSSITDSPLERSQNGFTFSSESDSLIILSREVLSLSETTPSLIEDNSVEVLAVEFPKSPEASEVVNERLWWRREKRFDQPSPNQFIIKRKGLVNPQSQRQKLKKTGKVI